MLVARRPDAVRVQPCKRIKLSAVRFADLCMRVDLPLDKKPGHRASRPPGRRIAGLSRAAGRRAVAAGPLGRRGPWAAGRWAAGLLLAKPGVSYLNTSVVSYLPDL